MSQTPRSPVSREVSTELERVVRRWRQLPLDHALSYAGPVRALVQSLADQVAASAGVPATEVPDCGPATLMDQLTVMVYDAFKADASKADASKADASKADASKADASKADSGGDAPTSHPAAALSSTLAGDLASLRRGLG